MQIEYKKSLNREYMILRPTGETAECSSYPFRMILENRIPGLLTMMTADTDGTVCFYYDISGMQPLAQYLLDHPADEAFFRDFLREFAALSDLLQDYLIRSEGLLTDPEQIFFDPEKKCCLFGHFPVPEGDHRGGLLKLSGFLISRLPPNDRKAAAMGYDFYQCCVSGRLTAADLRRIVKTEEAEEEKERPVPEEEETAEQKTEGPERKEKAKKKKNRPAGRLFSGLVSGRTNRKTQCGRIRRRKRSGHTTEEEDEELFREIFRENAAHPKPVLEENGGTVLIRRHISSSGEPGCRLCPVDPSDGPVFFLTETEHRIGRSSECADLVIRRSTVSRSHAKLIRHRDSYALTDLSSRNGTGVNGKPVPEGGSIRLEDGDEVGFGDVLYRFRAGSDYSYEEW